MTTGTTKISVLLDTNILISAIGFGGKPRSVLDLVLENKLRAISSVILLAEFEEVVYKKFPHLAQYFEIIQKHIREKWNIVAPKKLIHIVRDEDDNRVLEAAVEGRCQFIITGDSDLLNLGKYKKIRIVTAEEFLTFYLCSIL